jgi:hypothetical protein
MSKDSKYIPTWGVSPTQETFQEPSDDEVAPEDDWYYTKPLPPSPPVSPKASPQVKGRPQVDMRERVYVKNPHSSFPPFITQMELENLSSPTTAQSSKKGVSVTPNSTIKTGQWLDKLPSSKKKKASKTTNTNKSDSKKKTSSKDPVKKGKPSNKFKIGSVVSSLGVGKLLPLVKGERCRKRERVYGIIKKKSNSFEGSWHVKFANGAKGVFRESQLKFDNTTFFKTAEIARPQALFVSH